MTQCQIKQRHSMTLLAQSQTLDYIEVIRHDTGCLDAISCGWS